MSNDDKRVIDHLTAAKQVVSGGVMAEPCREKSWEELDSVERIERMRNIIVQQDNRIRTMSEIIDKLIEHSHDQLGRITAPMNPHNVGGPYRHYHNPLF
jgi:hypothetical protein